MTGVAPLAGCYISSVERHWHPLDAVVAVESFANVKDRLVHGEARCAFVCGGFIGGRGVAYSIALGSGVAAITLWDRPCDLQRDIICLSGLSVRSEEVDDYNHSKYHLSDRRHFRVVTMLIRMMASWSRGFMGVCVLYKKQRSLISQ